MTNRIPARPELHIKPGKLDFVSLTVSHASLLPVPYNSQTLHLSRKASADGTSVHLGPIALPDNTAIRMALWRALHLEADAPRIPSRQLRSSLSLPRLAGKTRPDTAPSRVLLASASIVARARFVEDLLTSKIAAGISQYVILGAGLDTFAQRYPQFSSQLHIFEIDQPSPQAWKRERLHQLGLGIPPNLHLVPVNFEAGDTWWQKLTAAGFDSTRPAFIASTGVSMYLTREAIIATLRQVAKLAPGSVLVMSFLLPIDQVDPSIRPGMERAVEGARASGTPFLSFFMPTDLLALARDAGFTQVEHVSADDLAQSYFANRPDGLRPPSNSEELLIATT
ncbi:MAG: class I SAM-dependent methyltransferase [Pirellulales bacterium]